MQALLGTIVRQLFDELTAHDVEYLVPRNYEALPDRVSNDLDVVVSLRHLRRFQAVACGVLKSNGLTPLRRRVGSNGLSIATEPEALCGPNGVRGLSVHAQLWISFEASRLQRIVPGFSRKVFFEDVRRQRASMNGCTVWIPEAIDEFLFLWRQWRFKRKPEYLARLEQYLRDEPVAGFLRSAWADEADALSRVKTDDERAWKRLLVERWGHQGAVAAARRYSRAAKGALHTRGLVLASTIYLAGPDGAGKTTMAAMIKEELEARGVRCRHFYSMKKNLLRDAGLRVQRLWASRRPRPSGAARFRWFLSEDITDRDTGKRIWRVRKFVRLCFGVVDIGICYLATLVFRWQGYTLIIETSPYDLFIKYHMPRFARLERVVCPLVPRPRLGLILRADPRAITGRKSELSVEEIEHYYLRLAEVLRTAGADGRFVEVPTGEGLDVSRRAVKGVVLEAL